MRVASRLSALLVLLLATLPALAQPSAELTSFSFLRIEPSARGAAVGGAFSAQADGDVNAFFYNPATLSQLSDGQLALSYLNHLAGLNMGAAAYSRQVGDLGTFAGGLRFLSYGEMDRADENGVRDGTFSASDVALTAGFSRPWTERLRLGGSVHLIHSSVDDYGASALAFDAGALYRLPAQLLTVSASINNAGVVVDDLGESDDQLPVDLRVSVAKALRYVPLELSITGYNLHDLGQVEGAEGTPLSDALQHLAIGGEFSFSESFQIRLGYNHRRHEALKTKERLDFAGISLGAGLKVRSFRLDYGFNSWSEIGRLHQFTVRTEL